MKNQSKRFFLLFVLWISTKLSLVPQSQRGFVQKGLLETRESIKNKQAMNDPLLIHLFYLLAFKIFLFLVALKENLTTTTVLFSCDTAIINLNFLFGNDLCRNRSNSTVTWIHFSIVSVFFFSNWKSTCPTDKSCQRFTCPNWISTCPGQLDIGFGAPWICW